MDYQLYTSQAEKTTCADHACSILNDQERLCQLARQTKYQQRSTGKITPRVLVDTMMEAAVTGAVSHRQLAVLCGMQCADTVAKQSVWDRLDSEAVKFLGAVLCQQLHVDKVPEAWHGTVQRILVGDSTTVSLHPDLHDDFPGSSNQCSKRQACVRIQTVADLLGGEFLQFGISGFTRNDQAASLDIIKVVEPGDLVLRDLGYFTLESLESIARKNAFFLSRLRYKTSVLGQNGDKIDLVKCFRSAARKNQSKVTLEILLGARKKLPANLVAFRLAPEVAAERRRKARADRDKRLNHDPAYYELLGWSILVTNLPQSLIEQTDLAALYGLRWRIENIFKAWKGGLNPGALSKHRTNPWHLRCLLLGQMLVLSKLGLKGWLSIATPSTTHSADPGMQTAPSLFKILDILLLSGDLRSAKPPSELLHRQLLYHGRYDRRQRPNLPQCVARFLA